MAVEVRRLEPLRRRDRWARKVMIALVLSYLAVTLFLPLVGLCAGAFTKGIQAFLQVFVRGDVRYALGLTFTLSLGAVLLNGFFGLIIAWVLVRHRFVGRRILNAFIDLPFAVSPVVVGYMMILVFGRQGWLYPWLESVGLKVVFSVPGMLIATTFVSLPFVIRELMPVLQEIGIEEEQAAHTLGASPWQTFWKVTLPSVRWALLYGLTLTFARALGEFGAVFIMSGAVIGYTETATLFVFRAMDERMYTEAYSVAFALALMSFFVLRILELQKRKMVEV